MPAETRTSCDTSPKSSEAFWFRGFHARGPWYSLAAERSRHRLKGKRGRAHSHTEGPRPPTARPPLSRQGRGISARRARGTNLLRYKRTVHKQHPCMAEGSERVKNKSAQLASAATSTRSRAEPCTCAHSDTNREHKTPRKPNLFLLSKSHFGP